MSENIGSAGIDVDDVRKELNPTFSLLVSC